MDDVEKNMIISRLNQIKAIMEAENLDNIGGIILGIDLSMAVINTFEKKAPEPIMTCKICGTFLFNKNVTACSNNHLL